MGKTQIDGGSKFRVYDIEKANALLQTEGYLAEVGAESDGFWDIVTEINPLVNNDSANGTIEYYAVRSVVEARKNQGAIFTEANVLGRLYGVNANKISSPHAQATDSAGVALTTGSFAYNVADLLKDVKHEFNNTFSLDVYQKLKMTRHKDKFSNNLLFKSPNSHGMSSRQLLEDR